VAGGRSEGVGPGRGAIVAQKLRPVRKALEDRVVSLNDRRPYTLRTFAAIIVGGTIVLMPATARTAPWAPAVWVAAWSAALVVLAAKTGEPLE